MKAPPLKAFYKKLADATDVCTCTNVDDIFFALKSRGVTDVAVDSEEMETIVKFTIANARGSEGTLEVIKCGKVDKFLGINVHEL